MIERTWLSDEEFLRLPWTVAQDIERAVGFLDHETLPALGAAWPDVTLLVRRYQGVRYLIVAADALAAVQADEDVRDVSVQSGHVYGLILLRSAAYQPMFEERLTPERVHELLRELRPELYQAPHRAVPAGSEQFYRAATHGVRALP